MRGLSSLLLLLIGCDRPSQVVLICHNANCAAPHDQDADDTIAGLEASLALGPDVLDGVELDLAWSRAEGRCVFAHDLDGGGPWPDAAEAASRVADFVTRSAEDVHVMIELKRAVDADGTRHTADERRAHADCALDVLATVGAAHEIIESFEPDLLRELATADAQLAATFSIPEPLGYSHTLDDFTGVDLDVVDVHPRFTSPADRRIYDALGYDVALWVEGVDTELFDALSADPPIYVVAAEAVLVRGWLDR